MAKDVRSELQKAADRVREIQVAVEVSRKNLRVCLDEVARIELELAEAKRNLGDTQGLLSAREDSLIRELHTVQNLTYAGLPKQRVLEDSCGEKDSRLY